MRVVASPGPFNFSEICNAGAAGADEDILVFLNNDTTVRQPDWLRRLAVHAARPEAGAVGAQVVGLARVRVHHAGSCHGAAPCGKCFVTPRSLAILRSDRDAGRRAQAGGRRTGEAFSRARPSSPRASAISPSALASMPLMPS